VSKDIKIKFDCSGFNAPAYSCSKPGDNSGFYVQSTDYDTLTKQVAELEFSLDDRDCYIADADMKNEELVKRVAELEKLGSDMADELEANYNNQRTRIMFMKWNKKLKESE